MLPDGFHVSASWPILPLKRLVEAKRGISYAGEDIADRKNAGLPFLNLKSFDKDGGYRPEGLKYFHGGYGPEHCIQVDDIVVANTDLTPTGDVIGAAALPPIELLSGPLLHSHHVTRLRLSAEVDKGFLYFLLHHPAFRHHMRGISSGTTVLGLDRVSLERTSVPVPPLPEQKKIAAILSSVDEAIQATQAVIDQTRRVKEGLLQDLLTRGLPGHTRFKQTEIGEIPESWEVRSARDLARKGDLVGGPFGSDLGAADYVAEGVPVIRGGNVGPGKFIETDFVYVSAEKAHLLSRNSARPGDLIMTQRGASLGEATLIPNDTMFASYVISQTMMRLRPNTVVVDPHFLIQSICSARAQAWLRSRAIGNAQPHLNLSIWQDMPLAVPPRKEQAMIALQVGSIEEAVMASEAARAGAQKTKGGLLQDLLTGRVRVTP